MDVRFFTRAPWPLHTYRAWVWHWHFSYAGVCVYGHETRYLDWPFASEIAKFVATLLSQWSSPHPDNLAKAAQYIARHGEYWAIALPAPVDHSPRICGSSDELAFRRMIALSPSEDVAPRLAYADWMHEHDAPADAELLASSTTRLNAHANMTWRGADAGDW